MNTGNIFNNIPNELPSELFETILKQGQVHIERIVSRGHTTEEGYWYDQAWDEWVILLQGQAVIAYEDAPSVALAAGDYVLIPAHCRHRVSWTDIDGDTIWLAVHVCA